MSEGGRPRNLRKMYSLVRTSGSLSFLAVGAVAAVGAEGTAEPEAEATDDRFEPARLVCDLRGVALTGPDHRASGSRR